MDNIKNNRFKLPLYINYYKGWEQENYYSEKYFNNLNEINKIQDINKLLNKNFCTLIARHDNWNTRKKIYEKLINIDNIVYKTHVIKNNQTVIAYVMINNIDKFIYLEKNYGLNLKIKF